MLTKPVYGWSDFQLEGTGVYGLSYLDDIAFEWVALLCKRVLRTEPLFVYGQLLELPSCVRRR